MFLAYPSGPWPEGRPAAGAPRGRAGAPGRDRLGERSPRARAAVAGSARPLRFSSRSIPVSTGPVLATPEAVVDVARVRRDAGLAVVGVFSHGGHGYRIDGAAGAETTEAAKSLGCPRTDALRGDPVRVDVDQRRIDAVDAQPLATGEVNDDAAGLRLLRLASSGRSG